MIKCGKIERGKPHPSYLGFEKISAYSNGPKEWQPLSPFNLGPFPIIEKYIPFDILETPNNAGWKLIFENGEWKKTINCLSFERYWQGCKVYKEDLVENQLKFKSDNIPELLYDVQQNSFSTEDNFNMKQNTFNIEDNFQNFNTKQHLTLNSKFYSRRIDIFTNPNREKTHIRHPLPKAKYGFPIYGFYNNEFINYVPSRKKYYCPFYEYLASQTPTYQRLLQKHQNGQNLLICGPDGLDVEINLQNMITLINNPKVIFGHELVLCCMLAGIKPWLY